MEVGPKEMKTYELATFAGGCFWCMVSPFDKIPGVKKVVSGYTGGYKENPTYEEVCSKETGHYEACLLYTSETGTFKWASCVTSSAACSITLTGAEFPVSGIWIIKSSGVKVGVRRIFCRVHSG